MSSEWFPAVLAMKETGRGEVCLYKQSYSGYCRVSVHGGGKIVVCQMSGKY